MADQPGAAAQGRAISINGIHHVGMSVPDIEKAREFYVELLGFELVNRVEWGGADEVDAIMRLRGSSGKMMILRTANAFIEMFEFATPVPDAPEGERGVNQYGFTHLCLDVSDTDAAYARLLAAGMDFHCKPVGTAGVKAVYGRDPSGNVIELQQIVDDGTLPRLPALACSRPG
jgi:catechol 2,3-dioxygenase-like lactoylglutathione lyase family enzyme